MFYDCKNVKSIDISGLFLGGVKEYDDIFKGVGNNIIISYNPFLIEENIENQIKELNQSSF